MPTILKYKLRQTRNTFSYSSRRKKLGWLISISFIIPYYTMLTRSMSAIYGGVYTSHGWQTMSRLAGLNLAMIFFFILVSTAALTLYRMFQAKDLSLLMSLPTQDSSLFGVKIFESLADVGRNMILPFPICIAFISVIVRIKSPIYAAVFFIGWIGIAVQLASLSVIIALVLGKIIATRQWAGLMRIIAIIVVIIFLIMFMGYVQRAHLNMSLLDPDKDLPMARFMVLSAPCPTTWLLKVISPGDSGARIGLLHGMGFIAFTIACAAIAFHIFKRRFRQVWATTIEATRRNAQKRIIRSLPPVARPGGKARALVIREVRILRREPHTWIGMIIPLVLFPIFIFFRSYEQGIQSAYIVIVSLLSTASYALSSVGREGRGFSFLRSLPTRVSTFLKVKFMLGSIVNLIVTFLFVVALYLTRRSSPDEMWNNIFIAVITSIYLSAFGTALSALFPKFDFTNPLRAASLPGTLILYLITAFFGFTLVGVTYLEWYFAPLALAPWAGIALILMMSGIKRLEKIDL